MPKKGEKQPYKVEYTYPGRKTYRRAFSSYNAAEQLAGEIGQRKDGRAVVSKVISDLGVTQLAEFGNDVVHLFEWWIPGSPRMGMICRCGYQTSEPEKISAHMIHAGLCGECWGTELVTQRAVYDAEGTPMTGNLITCPACQGTGRSAEADFHDVDPLSYYNRFQGLTVDEALRQKKAAKR